MRRTYGAILVAAVMLAGCGENDGTDMAREAYAQAQFAKETDIDLATRIDSMQREIDDLKVRAESVDELRTRVEYLESRVPA